jgi:hypothetical protein
VSFLSLLSQIKVSRNLQAETAAGKPPLLTSNVNNFRYAFWVILLVGIAAGIMALWSILYRENVSAGRRCLNLKRYGRHPYFRSTRKKPSRLRVVDKVSADLRSATNRREIFRVGANSRPSRG